MKKNIIVVIVLTIIVIGGVLVISKRQSTTIQPVNNTVPTVQTNKKKTITIKNFSFAPMSLTVKVGTKVIWKNEDSATHTIKSDIFSSPNLATGDTFEYFFKDKGDFTYICSIHPSMKGTITVD